MWGLLHNLFSSGGRFLRWTPRGKTQNRTNSLTVNRRGTFVPGLRRTSAGNSTFPEAIRLTRTRQKQCRFLSRRALDSGFDSYLTATCNRSGRCSSRNGRLEQPNVR